MTKTLIDLDETVLDRALALSGLKTKKAVVNDALEAYVRRLELNQYLEFAASGALSDLADETVIAQAQR